MNYYIIEKYRNIGGGMGYVNYGGGSGWNGTLNNNYANYSNGSNIGNSSSGSGGGSFIHSYGSSKDNKISYGAPSSGNRAKFGLNSDNYYNKNPKPKKQNEILEIPLGFGWGKNSLYPLMISPSNLIPEYELKKK
jgi:hypothetical protein